MTSDMNNPAAVSTRLNELLLIVEESAQVLRNHLMKEIIRGESPRASFDHPFPFFGDSQAANHASIIKIACERLDILVTPPLNLMVERTSSFYRSTALHICLKHNIAKLIRDLDTDNQGVPIAMLGKAAKLDADLLGRLLRFLSQRGIFQEVEPSVFKNTTASSTVIDDLEYKALMDLWITDNAPGVPKFESYTKALYEAQARGGTTPPSPFAMATGSEWYEYVELNTDRAKNFNLAMRGQARGESTFSLPFDFDFSALSLGTTLVDVGGGVGSIAEVLLSAYPNMKIVLQDIESVVRSATESPNSHIKRFMDEGRLSFQVQDFFSEQPKLLEGSVFMLSNVLHNHPHSKAVQILKMLRRSNPSRLIIVDRILGPFFPMESTTSEGEKAIYAAMRSSWKGNGLLRVHLPPRSQVVPAQYDMVMTTMFGAKTRGLREWETILDEAGFSLLSLAPLRASSGQTVLEVVIRIGESH